MASANDKYMTGDKFYFTDADGNHHETNLEGRDLLSGMTEVEPRRFADADGNVYRVPEWEIEEFTRNNIAEGRKVSPQFRMRQGGGNIGDALSGNVGANDVWVSDFDTVRVQELKDRGWQRVEGEGDMTALEAAFSPKTYTEFYSDTENLKDLPENIARGVAGAAVATGTGVVKNILGLSASALAFGMDVVGAKEGAKELRRSKSIVDEMAGKVLDWNTDNILGEAFFNEGDGTREMVKGGLKAAEELGGLYGLGMVVRGGGKLVAAGASALKPVEASGRVAGALVRSGEIAGGSSRTAAVLNKMSEAGTAGKVAMATVMGAQGYEDTLGAAEADGKDASDLRVRTAAAINGVAAAATAPLFGKLTGIVGKDEAKRVIMRSYGHMLKMAGLDTVEGALLGGATGVAGETADMILGGETDMEERAKRVFTSMAVGGGLVLGTKVPGALGGWVKQNRQRYAAAAAYQGREALETVGRGMPLTKSEVNLPDVKAVTVNGEVVFNDGSIYRPGRGERTLQLGGGLTRTVAAEQATVKLADGTILDMNGRVISVAPGKLTAHGARGEAQTPAEVVYRETDPDAANKLRIVDPATGEYVDVAEINKLQAPESVRNWFAAKAEGRELPQLDADGWAYMSLYQQSAGMNPQISQAAQLALEQVRLGKMTYRQAAELVDNAITTTMGKNPSTTSIYGFRKTQGPIDPNVPTADDAEEVSAREVRTDLPALGFVPDAPRVDGALPRSTVTAAERLVGYVKDGTIAPQTVDVTALPITVRMNGADPALKMLDDAADSPVVIVRQADDGTMTVLTGQNTVEKARLSGVKTIEAVTVREEDGWDVESARAISALAGLEAGGMSLSEAVAMVRRLGLSREDAQEVAGNLPDGRPELVNSAVDIAERISPVVADRVTDDNVAPIAALSEGANMRTLGLEWENVQNALVQAMPDFADAAQAKVAGIVAANMPGVEPVRAWQIAEWVAAHAEDGAVVDALSGGAEGIRAIERMMAGDAAGTTPVEEPDGSFKTVNEIEAEAGGSAIENIAEPAVDRSLELSPVKDRPGTFGVARFPRVRVTAVTNEGGKFWVVEGLTAPEMLDGRNRYEMGKFLSELADRAAAAGIEIDLGDGALVEIANELVANYGEENREKIMLARQNAVTDVLKKSHLADDVVSDPEKFNEMLMTFPEGERFVKDGKTWGFYNPNDGKVYINAALFGTQTGLNVTIHEFAHPAVIATRKANPELYARGMELVGETDFYREVSEHPDYKDRSERHRREEALVRLLTSRLEDIKANVPAKIYKEIEEFVNQFWRRFGEANGIRDLTPAMVQTMTVEDIADAIGAEMMSGKMFGAAELSLAEGDLKAKIDRHARYGDKINARSKASWLDIQRSWKRLAPEQKAALLTWGDSEALNTSAARRYARAFRRLQAYDQRRAALSEKMKKQARRAPNEAQKKIVRSSRKFYLANGTEDVSSPWAYMVSQGDNGLISIPGRGEYGYDWWVNVIDGMNKDARRDLKRLLAGRKYTTPSVNKNDTVVEAYLNWKRGGGAMDAVTHDELMQAPSFEEFMDAVLAGEAEYQKWKREGQLTLEEREAKDMSDREAYEEQLAWEAEDRWARTEAERMGDFETPTAEEMEEVPFARALIGGRETAVSTGYPLSIRDARNPEKVLELLSPIVGKSAAQLGEMKLTRIDTASIEHLLNSKAARWDKEGISRDAKRLWRGRVGGLSVLDDIIATSNLGVEEFAKHHNKDWKKGAKFYRADTRFAIEVKNGYEIYPCQLIVAELKNGERFVYDLVEIKKPTLSASAGNANLNMTLGSTRTGESVASDGSISQTGVGAQEDAANKDIRFARGGAEGRGKAFRLARPVEQRKELIAVHNLKESDLTNAAELEGLPAPSIAVVKDSMGHDNYGPISLVFRSDVIDPKADRNNKVYSSDAWTPTRGNVRIENKVIDDKLDRIVEALPRSGDENFRKLFEAFSAPGSLSAIAETAIADGEYYRLWHNNAIMLAYLNSKGRKVPVSYREESISHNYSNAVVKGVADAVGDQIAKIWENGGKTGDENAVERMAEIMRPAAVEAKDNEDPEKTAERRANGIPTLGEKLYGTALKRPWDLASAVMRYRENGFSQVVDTFAVGEAMRQMLSPDDPAYQKWVRKTFAPAVGAKGIRNKRDTFTPRGDRRSWEALHDEVTAQRIVDMMYHDSKAVGGNGFGGYNPEGAAVRQYASIDEMRRDRDRLQAMPKEKWDKLRDETRKDFIAAVSSLQSKQKHYYSDNPFIELDSIQDIVLRAWIDAKGDKSKYLANCRNELHVFDKSACNDIWDVMVRLRNAPTKYFEAKPERVVGFDEVAYAVVPDDASADVLTALADRGVKTVAYKAGDNADRLRVVNEMAEAEEVKFARGGADRSVFVAGRARVVEDAGAGERTPGAIAASKELSRAVPTALSQAGQSRYISLPLSELEWLRKRLTGNAAPAHVAGRIPGGANAAHNRAEKLVIAADIFGSVDKTDMAEIKDALKAAGYFRDEDPAWCLTQNAADVQAEHNRSESKLADELIARSERRIAGREAGGHAAARGIYADELAKIVMNLPSGQAAPGTIGKVKTIADALMRRVSGLADQAERADYFLDWAQGGSPETPRTDKERAAQMFGAFMVMPLEMQSRANGWFTAIVGTIVSDPKLNQAWRALTIRSTGARQSADAVTEQILRSVNRSSELAIHALQEEGRAPIPAGDWKARAKEEFFVGIDDKLGCVVARVDDRVRAYRRAKKEVMKKARTPQEKAQLQAEIDRFMGEAEKNLNQFELSRTAYERGAFNEGLRYLYRMRDLEDRATLTWKLSEDDKLLYLNFRRVIETDGRSGSFGISPRQAQIELEAMETKLGPERWAHLVEYGKEFHAIIEQEVLDDPRVTQMFGKDFVDYCRTQTNYVTTKRTFSPEELEQIEITREAVRQSGVHGGDDVITQMFTYGQRSGGIGKNENLATQRLKGSMAAAADQRAATWEKHQAIMQAVRRNAIVIDLKRLLIEAGVTGVSDHRRGADGFPNNRRYGHLDYMLNGQKRTLVVPKEISDGFNRDAETIRLLTEINNFARKGYIDWNIGFRLLANPVYDQSGFYWKMPGTREPIAQGVTRAVVPGGDALFAVVSQWMARKIPVVGKAFGSHSFQAHLPKAQAIVDYLRKPHKWSEAMAKAEARGDTAAMADLLQLRDEALEVLRANMFLPTGSNFRYGKSEGFAADVMSAKGMKTSAQIAESEAAMPKRQKLVRAVNIFKKNAAAMEGDDMVAKAAAYFHDRMAFGNVRTVQETGALVKKNVATPEFDRKGKATKWIQSSLFQFFNVAEKGMKASFKAAKDRPGETAARAANIWAGRIISGLLTSGVAAAAMLKAAGGDEEKARKKFGTAFDWANFMFKASQNHSNYMRENYAATPIWMSKNGYTTISIAGVISPEDRFITPWADYLVQKLASDVYGIAAEPSLADTAARATIKNVVPDLQLSAPAFKIINDAVVSHWENPTDFFTGQKTYDKDVWAMRGESLGDYGRFAAHVGMRLWNDLGGRAIFQFDMQGENVHDEAPETVTSVLRWIPSVSPGLSRFIKIQVGSPEKHGAAIEAADDKMQMLTRTLAKRMLSMEKDNVPVWRADPEKYEATLDDWQKRYGFSDWTRAKIEEKYINASNARSYYEYQDSKKLNSLRKKAYQLGFDDAEVDLMLGEE